MNKMLIVVAGVAVGLALTIGTAFGVIQDMTEPTVEVNGTAIEDVSTGNHHTHVTLNDPEVVTRLVVTIDGSEYMHTHPSNKTVGLYTSIGTDFTIKAQTGETVIGTATVKR